MTGQSSEIVPSEAYWQALLSHHEMPAAPIWPEPPDEIVRTAPERRSPTVTPGTMGFGHGAGRCEESWETLEAWHAAGTSFGAPVIGCNKGGLLVRVSEGIGFVPASQLANLPCSLGTADLRADLECMVGRELRLRVIELDRARNRVICSERATQFVEGDIEARLEALDVCLGCPVEGVVRSLCDFGAFVDLGGIDGLIHISELSWQRLGHPSEVLAVNQPVKVIVLSVDRPARRVALSYKRLREDPWVLVGERYAVGDEIDAVITHVVHFGAFARVPEGVEGLVHISEISEASFEHPADVVSEGQCVRVRVLHIDAPGRRLGLSLRQVH